jgi:hypothetical protein
MKHKLLNSPPINVFFSLTNFVVFSFIYVKYWENLGEKISANLTNFAENFDIIKLKEFFLNLTPMEGYSFEP